MLGQHATHSATSQVHYHCISHSIHQHEADKPNWEGQARWQSLPLCSTMQSHSTGVSIWDWDFQDGSRSGLCSAASSSSGTLQIMLFLRVGSPTLFARFEVLGNCFPSYLVPSTFSPQGYIIDVLVMTVTKAMLEGLCPGSPECNPVDKET